MLQTLRMRFNIMREKASKRYENEFDRNSFNSSILRRSSKAESGFVSYLIYPLDYADSPSLHNVTVISLQMFPKNRLRNNGK